MFARPLSRCVSYMPRLPFQGYLSHVDHKENVLAYLTYFLANNPLTGPLVDLHFQFVKARLDHYGLRFNDLKGEGQVLDMTLDRVAPEEKEAYMRRVIRAIDLKHKKEHLPHELAEKPENGLWLEPHMDIVVKELQEAEAYDRYQKY